jgi:hypothetical protein
VPANVHNTWILGHDKKVMRFKQFKLWNINDTRRRQFVNSFSKNEPDDFNEVCLLPPNSRVGEFPTNKSSAFESIVNKRHEQRKERENRRSTAEQAVQACGQGSVNKRDPVEIMWWDTQSACARVLGRKPLQDGFNPSSTFKSSQQQQHELTFNAIASSAVDKSLTGTEIIDAKSNELPHPNPNSTVSVQAIYSFDRFAEIAAIVMSTFVLPLIQQHHNILHFGLSDALMFKDQSDGTVQTIGPKRSRKEVLKSKLHWEGMILKTFKNVKSKSGILPIFHLQQQQQQQQHQQQQQQQQQQQHHHRHHNSRQDIRSYWDKYGVVLIDDVETLEKSNSLQFDVILITNALALEDCPVCVLRALKSKLSPSGRVLITVQNSGVRPYNQGENETYNGHNDSNKNVYNSDGNGDDDDDADGYTLSTWNTSLLANTIHAAGLVVEKLMWTHLAYPTDIQTMTLFDQLYSSKSKSMPESSRSDSKATGMERESTAADMMESAVALGKHTKSIMNIAICSLQ